MSYDLAPGKGLARMRNRLLFGAAVAAALIVPAFADGYRLAEVILKNGKKYPKCEVDDHGDIVKLKIGGGELELTRDQIEKITYLEADKDPGTTKPKKTWTKLYLDDGRTLTGDLREDGDFFIIKTKFGEQKLKKSQVLRTEVVPAEDEDENAEATGPDLERFPDFDGHFLLERPGPEWKLLRKSLAPNVRAQMNLTDKDAYVRVSVRAAAAPWTDQKDLARKVSQEAELELKREFERGVSVRSEPVDFFGSKVFELHYSGTPVGEKTEYDFIELRFERGGFVYAVTGGADKKVFPEVQTQLRAGLESFSLLPTVSFDESSFADLGIGFSIERPNDGWSVLSRPFDDKMPVELRAASGKAVVKVIVQEMPSGKSAATATEEWCGGRLAAFNEKPVMKNADRNGTRVETFTFKGFEANSSKLRGYRGAGGVVGKKLIIAAGEYAENEDESTKLMADVQLAVDRFLLHDAVAGAERMRKGQDAMKLLSEAVECLKQKGKAASEGVKKCTDALALFENFARAYYIRALCHEELKEWKELRDDLEAAARLDPRPEYDTAIARSNFSEAVDRAKEKKYDEAEKAFRRAYKADPKDDKIKKEMLANYKAWWSEVKKGPIPEASKFTEKVDATGLCKDGEFEKFLIDCWVDIGETILKDKTKYTSAEGYARKALRRDKDNSRAKSLLSNCERAEKDAQKPKKK
jgi:tetratricopeptide (TPR) repeat protein